MSVAAASLKKNKTLSILNRSDLQGIAGDVLNFNLVPLKPGQQFSIFQAEDCKRGTSVTGVQTCALPICPTNGFRQNPSLLRSGAPLKKSPSLPITSWHSSQPIVRRAKSRRL